MIGAYRNEDLGRLVGGMCNGTITADETIQLDGLLTKDEGARRFYNNYMFLHAELYSQHVSLEAVELTEGVESNLERIGASSTPSEKQRSRAGGRQTSRFEARN